MNKLCDRGRILATEWISAADAQHAKLKAAELCGAEVASIELWNGQTRVAVLDCRRG